MSISDKVKQAWTELPEKEKKIFCKSIQREEPKKFEEWCFFAGLTSGFRLQTVAKREIGANKLDKALFELRDGEVAGLSETA